jgi:hypothetical protein
VHDHPIIFNFKYNMKKNSVFTSIIFIFCLYTHLHAQQWLPGLAGSADEIRRTGITGIGFSTFNAATNAVTNGGNVRSLFVVNGNGDPTTAPQGSLLSHWISGTVGSFTGKWSGLGVGNPGNFPGVPNPYGLSIADNNNVGFFNLFPRPNTTITRDLVVGFGEADANDNFNRFILRSYFGNNASLQKDLLIANPRGAVGINEEPFASLSVYSGRAGTLDPVVPGNPNPIVRAIAIRGDQPFFVPDPTSRITTASAMGNQANNSLALSGVAVEGTRSQIPSFVPDTLIPNPPTLGIAVNLQVVADPSGGPNSTAVAAAAGNREYAELTWQDLDYLGITDLDCNNAALAAANKFYISFRNGQPGVVGNNAFSVNNKRPVMTFVPNGRVGINNINPVCQIGGRPVFLDVNGWVNSNNGFLVGSDKRFKKDINTIESAMDKVRQLRGTTYHFDQAAFPERAFDAGLQYGFIAQELEKVMPELTGVGTDGYYAVNYTAIIPVLTEAIKEQDKTITELSTELAQLRQQFADFKTGQQGGDAQGFRLEQNAPNPFGQSTLIRYALPAGTTGARISVYDLSGRLLKAFPISGTEGQVEMQANTLPDGLYIYDLQVNGRQVLERKMSVVKE